MLATTNPTILRRPGVRIQAARLEVQGLELKIQGLRLKVPVPGLEQGLWGSRLRFSVYV